MFVRRPSRPLHKPCCRTTVHNAYLARAPRVSGMAASFTTKAGCDHFVAHRGSQSVAYQHEAMPRANTIFALTLAASLPTPQRQLHPATLLPKATSGKHAAASTRQTRASHSPGKTNARVVQPGPSPPRRRRADCTMSTRNPAQPPSCPQRFFEHDAVALRLLFRTLQKSQRPTSSDNSLNNCWTTVSNFSHCQSNCVPCHNRAVAAGLRPACKPRRLCPPGPCGA